MFVHNAIKTCDNYSGLWCDIYSKLHAQSNGNEKWNLIKVRGVVEVFLTDILQMQPWSSIF